MRRWPENTTSWTDYGEGLAARNKQGKSHHGWSSVTKREEEFEGQKIIVLVTAIEMLVINKPVILTKGSKLSA